MSVSLPFLAVADTEPFDHGWERRFSTAEGDSGGRQGEPMAPISSDWVSEHNGDEMWIARYFLSPAFACGQGASLLNRIRCVEAKIDCAGN